MRSAKRLYCILGHFSDLKAVNLCSIGYVLPNKAYNTHLTTSGPQTKPLNINRNGRKISITLDKSVKIYYLCFKNQIKRTNNVSVQSGFEIISLTN